MTDDQGHFYSQVYALDFTAAFLMAAGMGADIALFAEVLPAVETVVVEAGNQE